MRKVEPAQGLQEIDVLGGRASSLGVLVRHEASDRLHRFGHLPLEIAVHDIVVGETQDHVPATQELAVALQVLLTLFFRGMESLAVHLDDDEAEDDHVDLADPLDPYAHLRVQSHVDQDQARNRLQDRPRAIR